jgi:CheY-like chemotaxis protein
MRVDSASLPDVLLLDDEPAVQLIVSRALESRGFKVFASTHWSDVATRVFEARAKVFLVADLNMPGIRGEDFCRIVKNYNEKVVLVLFTGAEREHVEAASRRLGGVQFVLKREGAARLCDVLELLRRPAGGAS